MSAKHVVDMVTAMADELAEPLHLEIVDVEFRREAGGRVLRVFIDKPGGITLDDCQALSRALSRKLDEADPIADSYSLEVSSPGLDRPLKRPEDFHRFAGEAVHVRTYGPLDGRRNFKGELIGLQDGHVVVQLDDGPVRIPTDQIARARLDPRFDPGTFSKAGGKSRG